MFVGLYVSDFSELGMLLERHALDESCGGNVIFLEVGEVLKGNIDFENRRLSGQTWLIPAVVAMHDK